MFSVEVEELSFVMGCKLFFLFTFTHQSFQLWLKIKTSTYWGIRVVSSDQSIRGLVFRDFVFLRVFDLHPPFPSNGEDLSTRWFRSEGEDTDKSHLMVVELVWNRYSSTETLFGHWQLLNEVPLKRHRWPKRRTSRIGRHKQRRHSCTQDNHPVWRTTSSTGDLGRMVPFVPSLPELVQNFLSRSFRVTSRQSTSRRSPIIDRSIWRE